MHELPTEIRASISQYINNLRRTGKSEDDCATINKDVERRVSEFIDDGVEDGLTLPEATANAVESCSTFPHHSGVTHTSWLGDFPSVLLCLIFGFFYLCFESASYGRSLDLFFGYNSWLAFIYLKVPLQLSFSLILLRKAVSLHHSRTSWQTCLRELKIAQCNRWELMIRFLLTGVYMYLIFMCMTTMAFLGDNVLGYIAYLIGIHPEVYRFVVSHPWLSPLLWFVYGIPAMYGAMLIVDKLFRSSIAERTMDALELRLYRLLYRYTSAAR